VQPVTHMHVGHDVAAARHADQYPVSHAKSRARAIAAALERKSRRSRPLPLNGSLTLSEAGFLSQRTGWVYAVARELPYDE